MTISHDTLVTVARAAAAVIARRYNVPACDREDFAHDVCVRLLEHRDAFDPARATLDTWAWRIAERLLVSQHRRRRVAAGALCDPKLRALTAQSEDLLPPDVRYERAAAQQAVRKFLDGTRPSWSRVLVMRYLDDHTAAEVATSEGLRYIATTSLLDRARRAAAHALTGVV